VDEPYVLAFSVCLTYSKQDRGKYTLYEERKIQGKEETISLIKENQEGELGKADGGSTVGE